MRSVLALAFVTLAAAQVKLPNLFGSCTGTKAPVKSPPACYGGKASVLGGAFSEGVLVTIRNFDYPSNKGTMDIHATGVSPENCKSLPFEKDGQDIKFDASHCLSGAHVSASYCSDQDQILLHVEIPHFPIASLPVTLSPEPCAHA